MERTSAKKTAKQEAKKEAKQVANQQASAAEVEAAAAKRRAQWGYTLMAVGVAIMALTWCKDQIMEDLQSPEHRGKYAAIGGAILTILFALVKNFVWT